MQRSSLEQALSAQIASGMATQPDMASTAPIDKATRRAQVADGFGVDCLIRPASFERV
ncbi:MAG: hypothetical protein JNJ46_06600 [Myxococcales bacterium]|nr:hypothetical protein [Myxococcales bacterium]